MICQVCGEREASPGLLVCLECQAKSVKLEDIFPDLKKEPEKKTKRRSIRQRRKKK